MKTPPPYAIFFVLSIILMVTMGCALANMLLAETPTPTSIEPTLGATNMVPPAITDTPAPAENETTEPVEAATATLPSPTYPVTESGSCTSDQCVFEGTFLLARPIGSTGRNIIDPTYRFGTNGGGKSDPNHGVSFLNSTGVPVLAAANGEVIVAGDDTKKRYARYHNKYGNLVILEHELPGLNIPVYTLYAHLSELFVDEGDFVDGGQEIGLVGASGDTSGSILHFEVRYGENSYNTVRNPDLWLLPLTDEDGQTQGTLAGRVVDEQGIIIPIPHFVIERLAGPGLPALDTFYTGSYFEKRLVGLNPWEESFALGDLPLGSYQITFLWNDHTYQRVVDILPGQLTYVTFQIEDEN